MDVCGDVKDLLQRNADLKQLLGLLENEEEQREGGVSPVPAVIQSSGKHMSQTHLLSPSKVRLTTYFKVYFLFGSNRRSLGSWSNIISPFLVHLLHKVPHLLR